MPEYVFPVTGIFLYKDCSYTGKHDSEKSRVLEHFTQCSVTLSGKKVGFK